MVNIRSRHHGGSRLGSTVISVTHGQDTKPAYVALDFIRLPGIEYGEGHTSVLHGAALEVSLAARWILDMLSI